MKQTNVNFEFLSVMMDEDFASVTINRPKVLNALNLRVIDELTQVMEELHQQELRAIILQGSGEKAFVAGADIEEMSQLDQYQALDFARKGQKLTQVIENLPFISIAVVQGYALGGGCELAMACDMIVATENAVFGQPEVQLGLIPGFGGTQRLIDRVGLSLAMDILCCGRKLSGTEAARCGLAARVCSLGELPQTLEIMKKGLLSSGPSALKDTKKLARMSQEINLTDGLFAEAQLFAAGFVREETRRGMEAFLKKEKPFFAKRTG